MCATLLRRKRTIWMRSTFGSVLLRKKEVIRPGSDRRTERAHPGKVTQVMSPI